MLLGLRSALIIQTIVIDKQSIKLMSLDSLMFVRYVIEKASFSVCLHKHIPVCVGVKKLENRLRK